MKAVVELSGGEVLSVTVVETGDEAIRYAYGLATENVSGVLDKGVMRSLRIQGSYSEGDWAVQIADAKEVQG